LEQSNHIEIRHEKKKTVQLNCVVVTHVLIMAVSNNGVCLNVLSIDGVHTGLSWSWKFQKAGLVRKSGWYGIA